MGHTYAEVSFYNPQNPSRSLVLKLLIDTGSTYTSIGRARLRQLDVESTGSRRFRTIKGEIIEREVGEAVAECMGERATTMVVLAGEGDAEVLGVHALEGLGLEVDPTTKELRKSEAILAI